MIKINPIKKLIISIEKNGDSDGVPYQDIKTLEARHEMEARRLIWGTSKKDFAFELGVSAPHYSKWIAGDHKPSASAVELARVKFPIGGE